MVQTLRLIYASRSTVSRGRDFEAELAILLRASRINNERDNVTGTLVYSDRCFAQVLEGGRDDVLRTFSRIQVDNRHADLCVLQSKLVERRLFEHWSLLFHRSECDRVEQMSGLNYRRMIERDDLRRETLLDVLVETVASETRRLDLLDQTANRAAAA